jgi:type VII secretion-associated serine protease mycosin
MGFTRALQAVAGAAIASALVFASAPVAAADQIRDDQWPLKAFDAEAIWNISKGKEVTVAVIDGGINAQHVDLKGNVIEGKDFIDGGSTTPKAGDSHGTGMASIIAGHGHGSQSSTGVMGLAPEAKVLDIRDYGYGNDGYASSIRYAVDHGASIINISQEQDHPLNENAETSAITYALKHNVLIFAGSGNDGREANGYPASYPGVVSVSGVKNDGAFWVGSNYGPHVMLSAPATSIISASAKSNSAYRSADGTSDATAYASAAAALLRAKFPELTPGQIVNRLVKTAGLPDSAKNVSLPDERYGYGFIQPLAALTRNIPAGSKYGPLTVPESLKQGSSDTSATSSSSNNTLKRAIFFTVLGLFALLIVALAIFVIVKIARRNKGGGNGPGGPGAPGGYSPGQPPYGQQPYQQQPQGNPYMTPQQEQPPSRWDNA